MSRSALAGEGSPAPAAAAPGADPALPPGLGPGGAGSAATCRFGDADRDFAAHPFPRLSPGNEGDLEAVVGRRIEEAGRETSEGGSAR